MKDEINKEWRKKEEKNEEWEEERRQRDKKMSKCEGENGRKREKIKKKMGK